MTITDQIKILNRKIMQNEAQYDLDRKAAKKSTLSSNNLDKYEYLTGEDLDLEPSTIEQAKFEYFPLGNIFNKGLNEDNKEEGLFKRLKNIEGKITGEKKKKNQNQLKLKINQPWSIKCLKKLCNSTGKIFLIKLVKDGKNIDYNNLLFKIKDVSIVKDADFLEEIGTLYNLLIYLLNNSLRIITSAQIEMDFFKARTVLGMTISNLKTDITDQSKEKKTKSFAEQENVLSIAETLLERRGELLDQFTKNNIISGDTKFFDAPKKIEKSTLKKTRRISF